MSDDDRDNLDDLGALFSRVTKRLIELERPVLARRRLSMWQYIALSALVRGSVGTQNALAEAIGYDKTRLITLLDELEQARLISRKPDPADRRARIVEITAEGRRRHAAAVADIRAMEDEVLAALTREERRGLLGALGKLAPDSR